MLGLAPRLPITITLLIAIAVASIGFVEPASRHGQGVLRFVFINAQLFPRGPYTLNWRAVRRFLDARAKRAAGRATASLGAAGTFSEDRHVRQFRQLRLRRGQFQSHISARRNFTYEAVSEAARGR
jgi:hypothetical protein